MLSQLGPCAADADGFDESPDDGEVDVSFEKRDSDFAENLGNLGVA
jgi:hypothetical protein